MTYTQELGRIERKTFVVMKNTPSGPRYLNSRGHWVEKSAIKSEDTYPQNIKEQSLIDARTNNAEVQEYAKEG